jgi:hypothetical protein
MGCWSHHDISIPPLYDVRAGKNRRPPRGGQRVAARRTRASTACGRRAPGWATRYAASGHVLPSCRSTPAGARTRERAWEGRHAVPQGWRGTAQSASARNRAGANRRAGDVALADWLALVQRSRLRFCSVSRDPDSGFAPDHASRVRFSPGSLLHQLGEACPALLTRESPLGRSVWPLK